MASAIGSAEAAQEQRASPEDLKMEIEEVAKRAAMEVGHISNLCKLQYVLDLRVGQGIMSCIFVFLHASFLLTTIFCKMLIFLID